MNNMIANLLRSKGIDITQAQQDPYGMIQRMMQQGQFTQEQVNAAYQKALGMTQQGGGATGMPGPGRMNPFGR